MRSFQWFSRLNNHERRLLDAGSRGDAVAAFDSTKQAAQWPVRVICS